MKLKVRKQDLLPLLKRCNEVADRKNVLPILGNVLIETDGKKALNLSASNLVVSVFGAIPAQTVADGAVAVCARDLFERVKMMPEGNITLSVGEHSSLTVTADGSKRRFTLHGMPGDDFPPLPLPPKDVGPAFLSETLLRLIAGTGFSISSDETRPHMNSALLEWEGRTVRMVSTDGHRLSKIEHIENFDLGRPLSILVPLVGIQAFKRVCEEDRGSGAEVTLTHAGPNVFLAAGGVTLSVKTTDAAFPPWRQVMVVDTPHTANCDRQQLASALRAVSASSNEAGAVKMTFGKGAISLSSESPDSGQGFDEVPAGYHGPEVTMGVNARYIQDALGAALSESVVLRLAGALDPLLIQPEADDEREQYAAMVMPVRVS